MRAGVKLVGPYIFFGSYPMYLFTVRGRKSELPRTVVLAIMERNGKRYVGSPYGIVDWVRNLRAAGEAILTRGRRSETVKVIELPKDEAPSFCEKKPGAATPSLASTVSPQTLHLRSLSVRWSPIRCLCWKGNSAGTRPSAEMPGTVWFHRGPHTLL